MHAKGRQCFLNPTLDNPMNSVNLILNLKCIHIKGHFLSLTLGAFTEGSGNLFLRIYAAETM